MASGLCVCQATVVSVKQQRSESSNSKCTLMVISRTLQLSGINTLVRQNQFFLWSRDLLHGCCNGARLSVASIWLIGIAWVYQPQRSTEAINFKCLVKRERCHHQPDWVMQLSGDMHSACVERVLSDHSSADACIVRWLKES